jgi:hypothetical protein
MLNPCTIYRGCILGAPPSIDAVQKNVHDAYTQYLSRIKVTVKTIRHVMVRQYNKTCEGTRLDETRAAARQDIKREEARDKRQERREKREERREKREERRKRKGKREETRDKREERVESPPTNPLV